MSEDKIIDKIKKLLALSQSANEHEAALAAARASELMLEHQISEAKLQTTTTTEEPIEEHVVEGSDKKCVMWKGELAERIAVTLGCKMFWLSRKLDATHKEVFTKILGRKSSVQTVEYLYLYLVAEINRLAESKYDPENDEEYQRAEQNGAHFSHRSHAARRWKEAFRLGATRTICNRLSAQREQTFKNARNVTGTELVVVNQAIAKIEKDIEKIMAILAAKKMKTTSFSPNTRSDGYHEGQRAGHDIDLNGTDRRALASGNKRLKG